MLLWKWKFDNKKNTEGRFIPKERDKEKSLTQVLQILPAMIWDYDNVEGIHIDDDALPTDDDDDAVQPTDDDAPTDSLTGLLVFKAHPPTHHILA